MNENVFDYPLYVGSLARLLMEFNDDLYESAYLLATKKELLELADVFYDAWEEPIFPEDLSRLEDPAVYSLINLKIRVATTVESCLNCNNLDCEEVWNSEDFVDFCCDFYTEPVDDWKNKSYDRATLELSTYLYFCMCGIYRLACEMSYYSAKASEDLFDYDVYFEEEMLKNLNLDDHNVALLHDLILDYFNCYNYFSDDFSAESGFNRGSI